MTKTTPKIKKKMVNKVSPLWILVVGLLFLIPSLFKAETIPKFNEVGISASQNTLPSGISSPELPRSAQSPVLNASIDLHQSAYLPDSYARITLKIHNGFSSSLQSLSMNISSLSDLSLITGSMNHELGILGVNETFSQDIICQLPANAESLDVVFLIDGSGSMTDEINEVKSKVKDMVNTLYFNVSSVRIGIIFFGNTRYDENPYNDDRNVLDLTSDVDSIQSFIDPWTAGGGWEPWGDALRYLKQLDWQSSARLAILITDEPCNSGIYIGDSESSMEYYDGPELYALAEELSEINIIVSTMQCYGGGEDLQSQLEKIAAVTSGIYVKLNSSSSSLMDTALSMCYQALSESGQKLIISFGAKLDGEYIFSEQEKWIIVDNQPPGLKGSIITIFDTLQSPPQHRFKVICKVFDASGVNEVILHYKFNSSSYLAVSMENSSWGIFSYLLPAIPENSIVKYYFSASDILGNFVETDIVEFEAKYELSELESPAYVEIVLNSHEGIQYELDLSLLEADTHLLVVSDSEVIGEIISNNISLSANISLDQQNPFTSFLFHPSDNTIFLSLTNLDEFSEVTIKIALCSSQNATIGKDKANITPVSLQKTSPVVIFQVDVDLSVDPGFFVELTSDNEFEFLQLMVFNQSEILKSHVFDKISVTPKESGVYYILIALIDERIDSLDFQLNIQYGEIDDTPYWEVDNFSGGDAIPGFNLLFVMVSIGIVLYLREKHRNPFFPTKEVIK
ncbi:VWA domain-containing protein [Candidatus Lokiarchaeum ossiferum]|uniref:VWA domain-containing protein n=1 Tax=Candidatus Lokiarchaeum ossiferum TaxID=2951803 RepID=UPI00352F91CF